MAAESSLPGGQLSGTTRVEAFSDGVIAIAITLLILEIRVPEHEDGELLRALGDIWPSYVAYLASFFTIGVIWMNHHGFFSRLQHLDRVMRWWNLMLLLGVSIMPFPTKVLAEAIWHGEHRDAATAAVIYGLAGVIMTMPWAPMWWHLTKHPELFRPGFDAEFARRERVRAYPGILVYAACIAVGVVWPVVALVLYLLVALFYGVTSQGWSARIGDVE